MLYGLTSVAIAVFYNVVWHYARLRGLLLERLDPAVVTQMSRGYAVGIVVYSLALLLTPVSATAAMLTWAGLAMFFLRGSPRPRLLQS